MDRSFEKYGSNSGKRKLGMSSQKKGYHHQPMSKCTPERA
jgi:hypothetical protein